MKHTHLVIDFMNLIHRLHAVTKDHSVDQQCSMTMHMFFTNILRFYKKYKPTDIIIATDSISWRYAYFKQYKIKNKLKKLEKTRHDLEDDNVFFEAIDALTKFLESHTNTIVISSPSAEADDIIARWVDIFNNDENIIISSDSDLIQLLRPNVTVVDPLGELIYKDNKVYYLNGEQKQDKDGNLVTVDPKYSLFLKCIRGDTSDCIPSAYPNVREKSSKNKIGILEAYKNMEEGGYAYNNFMNQTWTNLEDKQVLVKDAYFFNKKLIDLTEIPQQIKDEIDISILNSIQKDRQPNIGVYFMKFCTKWKLSMILDNHESHLKYLSGTK